MTKLEAYQKFVNAMDDFFEYKYKFYTREEIKDFTELQLSLIAVRLSTIKSEN